MSIWALISLLNSAVSLILGIAVYSLNRKDSLNRIFAVMCWVMFIWFFMEFAHRQAGSADDAFVWIKVQTLFAYLPLALMLHFSLLFTGRRSWTSLTWFLPLIYLSALAISLLDLTTGTFSAGVRKMPWGFDVAPPSEGWLFLITGVWVAATAVACLALSGSYYLSNRDNKKAGWFAAALVVPVFIGIPELLIRGTRSDVPELGTASFLWLSGLIAYAIWKYDLFTVNPSRAADSIISTMNDSLIILDRNGLILTANNSAVKLLGYQRSELESQAAGFLFSGPVPAGGWDHQVEKEDACPEIDRQETTLRRRDGSEIPIIFSSSAIRNRHREIQGTILMVHDITERKQAEQAITNIALHDFTTGLPNRFLFRDRLDQAIATADRNGSMIAVLFLDLDNFKFINDSLGHNAGDLLLSALAHRLSSLVRENDTVARLGGDEFAVVQVDLHNHNGAATLAEKILSSLNKSPLTAGDEKVQTSASIGIAVYPHEAKDSQELLSHADMAMYHAKHAGRSTFRFYDHSIGSRVVERMQMERDLRGAEDRGEIFMVYQPQVDLNSGEIVALEALMRWEHPVRGSVSPAQFIPVAEASGYITTLGHWALEEVCRQCSSWNNSGVAVPDVAVNVSVRQLRRPDFADSVIALLGSDHEDLSKLELELTESALMDDTNSAAAVLERLRGYGVRMSIDDFGTGYSSLSRLKQFPVSKLKIDLSFVRDIAVDPDDAAVVAAIVALADALHITTVAEGVETEEQLAYLRSLGCNLGQGFLFSVPLPGDEVARLLAKLKRSSQPDAA